MKLSDFLLWPSERIDIGDRLELTVFDNDAVPDPLAQEYLQLLVDCTSIKEAQMIMTLLYQTWADGRLQIDVDEFCTVEDYG